MRSMTGYGCGEAATPDSRVTVEVKTTNHRFRDIVIRIPRTYTCFEDPVRHLVQEVIARGRVEVHVAIEESGSKNVAVNVDKELAMAYYKNLEDLRVFLGLEDPVRLDNIICQPGVLVTSEVATDVQKIWPLIEEATRQALKQLVQMRETEGQGLKGDIRERLDHVRKACAAIEEEAPQVIEFYRKRLYERLNDVSVVVDPSRLVGEITLYAERSDITEELVRLKGHITRTEETLDADGPVGRQLDFLFQEMFRELNTIGNKAQNLKISQLVVEAKGELEKMREQVQNLE